MPADTKFKSINHRGHGEHGGFTEENQSIAKHQPRRTRSYTQETIHLKTINHGGHRVSQGKPINSESKSSHGRQMGLGDAVVPGELVFIEEAPGISQAEGDEGES